ncbi:MAG: NTP transferase domain-containing protein, partial [Perlucidibaca sp.]
MASLDEMTPCPVLSGLILAGGAGQRLGGEDKAWLPWRGQPLFTHVLARMAPQVASLWVSANRDPARYQPWLDDGSLRAVIADDWPGTQGPLAGLASALPRLRAAGAGSDWLLVTPVDTPRLPADLGARLWQGLQAAGAERRLAIARCGDQPHWLHMLLHLSLTDDLR